MPIPLYGTPGLRSPREPNPFDKSVWSHALRLCIGQMPVSGPVDGEGKFRGYPFVGGGSAGFPGPDAVLRSYLKHPGFELLFLHDKMDDIGGANVLSPLEALALMGLYMRWHNLPVILGGTEASWHPEDMRRSAAFTAMPAFERWNQAGRVCFRVTDDLTLESLNQTCLMRVSRAFRFRDIIFGLSATMAKYQPEEMLCELESLLISLVGAFDTAARTVDHILRLGTTGSACGWQFADRWQSRLEAPARELYEYTKSRTRMQQVFQVLRWLRNTVHHEALGLIRNDGTYQVTIPTRPEEDLRKLLREGHADWNPASLGIQVLPPTGATATRWLPGTGHRSVTVRRTGAPALADPLAGQITIDVRVFINKIFPASLIALNEIMRLVPLGQIPGYTTILDNPPRGNLPWNLSDTTGHRLRMLFGITELGLISQPGESIL
jgi:hypothetical protein